MLNINQYYHWHFFVKNKLKQEFNSYMDKMYTEPLKTLKKPVRIVYTVKYGTRRKVDFENIACIVSKFFCDWIVKRGLILDDNTDYIKEVVYKWGGYEKNNYTCYVVVEEL